MPQIVTKSYFTKANGLNIPLAIEIPTAVPTSTPSNSNYLDNLCIEVEKNLLLNSLGLTLYNQFQTALLNINNAINEKWKFLLKGQEYDGKKWIGLEYDLGFIAQKIYETYLTRTDEHLTMAGNVKANAENATVVTPVYKIASANQSFIKQYQKGYLDFPDIYFRNGFEFVDYYGNHSDIEVSFYQYLLDKKADFVDFDLSKFKTYSVLETKNSFGI